MTIARPVKLLVSEAYVTPEKFSCSKATLFMMPEDKWTNAPGKVGALQEVPVQVCAEIWMNMHKYEATSAKVLILEVHEKEVHKTQQTIDTSIVGLIKVA